MTSHDKALSDNPWVVKARRFCKERIIPIAEMMDEESAIPPNVVERMAREGFFGLAIPKEYGGAEESASTIAAVLEEISAASLAVSTNLAVHLSVASAPIALWGTEAQKEHWLPSMARGEWLGAFALTEPEYGSDAQHLNTRYIKNESGFLLNGSKTFITNGGSATVVLVFATVDPALEAKGITCFLVEKGTRGFTVARHLDKLGLRGSETAELGFEDCAVAPEKLLGREGEGFRIAMSSLEGGRIGIAATSLGVARAALQMMQEHLGEDSEIWAKNRVARAYVDVEAARSLVERAARMKDSGEDYGLAASAAKLFASQVAYRVASVALEAVWPAQGLSGLRRRAERIFRDSRVLTIVEGTTEIQELILGRKLTSRAGSS